MRIVPPAVNHRSVAASYFLPGRGAMHCVQPVSVPVHLHILKTTSLNFIRFSEHVTCGHGSVIV